MNVSYMLGRGFDSPHLHQKVYITGGDYGFDRMIRIFRRSQRN